MLKHATTPVQTGHVTFDRQANKEDAYVGTGNVQSEVQFSWIIRAKTTTEANGFKYAPGKLRDADLKKFSELPDAVKQSVKELSETRDCILYEFRHWKTIEGCPKKTVHGYILTDKNHRFLWDYFLGRPGKSLPVLKKMREYVAR
jgi:hypothetical protein